MSFYPVQNPEQSFYKVKLCKEDCLCFVSVGRDTLIVLNSLGQKIAICGRSLNYGSGVSDSK